MDFSLKQALGVAIVVIVAAIVIVLALQTSRTAATKTTNNANSTWSVTESEINAAKTEASKDDKSGNGSNI